MDPVSKRKMESLHDSIRKGVKLSAHDFRTLYELIGIWIRDEHGVSGSHNPCSVEVISDVVLRMAEEIKPRRLLNVGMGGYPFVDIELSRRGFKMTGLEYSASLIGIAREILSKSACGFPILLGDGQNLPFAEESFEACLCSETLEHLPDDRLAISEIHRILKPQGYLILTVPNLWAFLGWKKRMEQFMKTRSLITHPNHLREYTVVSILKILNGFFKIQSWHTVPFTTAPFSKMPYEKTLSFLTGLPFLKWGSLSYAFVLRKK